MSTSPIFAPTETAFTVLMTLVERPVQLAWCLHHLRVHYPTAPAIIISDGDGYEEYPEICSRYGASFVKGERLKRALHGGRWWQRVLEAGYSTGTDYLLKIDPDTKVQRKWEQWPSYDISGTVAGRGTNAEHIQGGVQLFSRNAVQKILDSKFFSDERLKDPATYAWNTDLLNHARRTNYLCSDAMLRAAKIALGLRWGTWSEALSMWKSLPNDHQRFAITHPHKWQNAPTP